MNFEIAIHITNLDFYKTDKKGGNNLKRKNYKHHKPLLALLKGYI